MRKKNKMANICRSLRKKKIFSPVLKSPTHIGFLGVKKNGSKISHLGTFKFEAFTKGKHFQFGEIWRPFGSLMFLLEPMRGRGGGWEQRRGPLLLFNTLEMKNFLNSCFQSSVLLETRLTVVSHATCQAAAFFFTRRPRDRVKHRLNMEKLIWAPCHVMRTAVLIC